VVKDVLNKLVDTIALELDDSTINNKSEPPAIIREFDTLRGKIETKLIYKIRFIKIWLRNYMKNGKIWLIGNFESLRNWWNRKLKRRNTG
jgi:hypothetical protein